MFETLHDRISKAVCTKIKMSKSSNTTRSKLNEWKLKWDWKINARKTYTKQNKFKFVTVCTEGFSTHNSTFLHCIFVWKFSCLVRSGKKCVLKFSLNKYHLDPTLIHQRIKQWNQSQLGVPLVHFWGYKEMVQTAHMLWWIKSEWVKKLLRTTPVVEATTCPHRSDNQNIEELIPFNNWWFKLT